MELKITKLNLIGGVVLATLLMPLLGCGPKSWKADTYPTFGTVTVNGEPAVKAFVRMTRRGEPIDERNSDCWAYVQEDGTFQMSTYVMGDGCPPGEYDLLLRWPVDPVTMMPDRLNGKYWNPSDPYMTVTINQGQNEIPPIELANVSLR